jgi:hypothetical protein
MIFVVANLNYFAVENHFIVSEISRNCDMLVSCDGRHPLDIKHVFNEGTGTMAADNDITLVM